jgi:hypothetical protein
MGTIMSQSSIPCRFDPGTAAFLRAEAKREGVSASEYIRRAVSRGVLANALQEAVKDIRGVSPHGGSGVTADEFRILLVNVLETRNLLRIISAKNFPSAATDAKRDAIEEVQRLLGDGEGDVG